MSRKGPTWFGIGLSKKQATNVFILSLVGIFLVSMILIPIIFSFITSVRSAILYGDFEMWIEYYMFYMLPYLCILITILIITIYSLIKSRKIAIFYSEVIDTQKSESRVLSFCSNCGNKKMGEEKFCKICGEELK